jgi:hypothetical protein
MKWTSSSSHWNVACTRHEVDIIIITLKCSLYWPSDDDDVHFMASTSYISMWWWWCPLHGEYRLHFNVMMMMSTSWWVQATFQCDDDNVYFMVSTSYISMWWWWCPLHGEYKLHFNWNVACTRHEVEIIITLKCSLYSPWSGHHHIEM